MEGRTPSGSLVDESNATDDEEVIKLTDVLCSAQDLTSHNVEFYAMCCLDNILQPRIARYNHR